MLVIVMRRVSFMSALVVSRAPSARLTFRAASSRIREGARPIATRMWSGRLSARAGGTAAAKRRAQLLCDTEEE
jgi:hypothetical protein